MVSLSNHRPEPWASGTGRRVSTQFRHSLSVGKGRVEVITSQNFRLCGGSYRIGTMLSHLIHVLAFEFLGDQNKENRDENEINEGG